MERTKAFSLVEALIASSIFVVVMTTIYSSFQAGIFGNKDIEENINIYQTARQILEQINLNLRNAFSYSADESKFTGEKDKLSFLTLVDSYQEEKILQDYAFVSYELQGDKLMRRCRRNQEALNDKSEIEPEEIGSYVDEIIFSYGYIEGGSQDLKWKDFWDGKTKLPLAVKVELSLKNKIKHDFVRTIYLPLAG